MMSLSRSRDAASTGRVVRLCGGLALSFAVGAVACSAEDSEPMPPLRGSAASGGASGAGGSTGSAGTSGTGGASGGSAGTSGSGGGGSSTATTVYDFSDSLEGFAINYYCLGPANSQNCSPVTSAPIPGADAGADAGDAGAAPPAANDFFNVTHDPTVGDPALGSAKVELNFTAGEQTAILALNYAAGANLTGTTITARVLVDAGAPATTSAKLYIKTGANFYYADRGAITLIAGTWLTLTYDTGLPPVYPAAPTAEYALSDVREIGIELAATGIATPALTVVHVDSVQY
jgi:hypothetical protein